ncbi:MAG: hypothetical protein CMC66_05200 [Flavobacteriaceae bacterium]|nr:hypothetical protein [Flavobacteriaceae bacterium]
MNSYIFNSKLSLKKLFLYWIIFLSVGEIIVRIDKKYNFSILKDDIKIGENFEKAYEWNDFPKNFAPETNQKRIMIIGDSHIHGIGFHASKRFSTILLDSLKKVQPDSIKPIILDLSRTGSNLIDNYLIFNEFEKKFKPHKILWFHNLADVMEDDHDLHIYQKEILGHLYTNKRNTTINRLKSDSVKTIKNIEKSYKKRHVEFYKKSENISELMNYLKYNIYNKLLSFGILIPTTKMHHVFKYAYLENSQEFNRFKVIFNSLISEVRSESDFIFYLMPRFNIIHREDYFKLSENALKRYFATKERFIFLNGRLDFHNIKSNKLTIIHTDSHPNAFAHKIILNKNFDLFGTN